MGILEGAIAALVVALIAGLLGFTNIAAGAASIAKLLFAVFLVIALIMFAVVLIGGTAAVAAG